MDNRIKGELDRILESYHYETISSKDINDLKLQICQLFEKPEPPDELTELREKIAQLYWFELAKREAKETNIVPPQSPREFYDQELIDKTPHYSFTDQILSLATPTLLAEGAKKERERLLEWLEYNAPEYVWQCFKDNKDIRKQKGEKP